VRRFYPAANSQASQLDQDLAKGLSSGSSNATLSFSKPRRVQNRTLPLRFIRSFGSSMGIADKLLLTPNTVASLYLTHTSTM
jgi:hypothetical protein